MGSEIEKLRALLASATPGPWHVGTEGMRIAKMDDYAGTSVRVNLSKGRDPRAEDSSLDAALIVAAVNALPALLDVCEAAEACRDAEAAIAAAPQDCDEDDIALGGLHRLAEAAALKLDAALSRLGGA